MSNLVEVLWSKKFLHKCDFVCSLILIFPYKALLWAFLWNELYSVRLYIPGDIWWSRFKQLCCWFTNLVKNVWKVSRLRIICSQAYILTFKMDSFCHSFLDSCPFPVKYQPRQKRPCIIERAKWEGEELIGFRATWCHSTGYSTTLLTVFQISCLSQSWPDLRRDLIIKCFGDCGFNVRALVSIRHLMSH